MLTLFRNRVFLAVSSAHFVVDTLNSLGPVLMALLATSLKLSNTQIGLALTLYTFAGSLSQPLFGWLADRYRNRTLLLTGLGVVWSAICYTIVAFQESWALILPFFLLAALGSGLFHPIGTATAATVDRTRAGGATSVFFFCGQMGFAIGPVLAGWLFGAQGSLGIIPLSMLALLPVGLLLAAPRLPAPPPVAKRGAAAAVRTAAVIVAAFVVLVALRSSIQATYTAFLPKLFADRGWEPAAFGALAGVFMLSAAIGGILTGIAADRFGMRAATVWPLLLSVPTGLVCLWALTPAIAFVAAALAGLFICGQHSILVLHAQRLLPAKQGFAAGLILGFTFASGGLGTWLAGVFADSVGLVPVMQVATMLALPTAALALTLPGCAPAPDKPAVMPAPAGEARGKA